ncbi:Aste57867_1883 [Aphanomyces stellatus]|uniref:Aste57867_1883 protein n=1 Tax=Aphanomyces stellatus TaxID=120398 RepID=A0A485K665_9STRA|nr:hypothetical protein As57867_001881 [Aphanomyces stellatus]VFT79090.1 Aste57867_1883 [Aphanomyces stellatus]
MQHYSEHVLLQSDDPSNAPIGFMISASEEHKSTPQSMWRCLGFSITSHSSNYITTITMPSALNILTSKAANVLACAFMHYPLMDYVFQGESDAAQRRKLQILFCCCAKAALLYGGVAQTDDLDGVLLWLPGPNASLGFWRELQCGMLALPFQLGVAQTLRLSQDESILQYILQHANVNQMGLIWQVGVHPKSQGKGYLRILMDRAIDDMKRQGMTEFWLMTDTPINVKRYERLGFAVVYSNPVQSSAYSFWVMRKLLVTFALCAGPV